MQKKLKLKNKEYHRQWYLKNKDNPDFKIKRREYNKAYYQIPLVKKRINDYSKKYNKIPEVKIKRNNYNKIYYKSYMKIPEVKARKKVILKRYMNKNGRKIVNEWRKRLIKNNERNYGLKYKARYLSKSLPKKDCCEECGSKEKLEKHHINYDNYKLIKTLCNKCHRRLHSIINMKGGKKKNG